MNPSPRRKKERTGVWLPPAVGYKLELVFKLLIHNRIEPRYYLRVLAMLAINLINLPFRAYERIFINPRINRREIKEDPVFIIGHWRSGTTHLHNLLNQDPRMGAVSTFQGVFPDTLFNYLGHFIFKNIMRMLIASKRLGDNVEMNADYPQEEEFAIGSREAVCYYYFWIFPEKTLEYYRQYIEFDNINDRTLKAWERDYLLLIRKALKKNHAERFLSKNPPNTGRIKELIRLFPDARFIHIHRNPVMVYLSTRHFFREMMPALQLHHISDEQMEEMILEVFDLLMHRYLEERRLVPEGNLIELPFEDLEKEPLKVAAKIYEQFRLPGFGEVKDRFVSYLQQSKGYRKNVHHISRKHLDIILDRWGFAMKEWGYEVPFDELVVDE